MVLVGSTSVFWHRRNKSRNTHPSPKTASTASNSTTISHLILALVLLLAMVTTEATTG